MTETELAAVVRAVVDNWTQTTASAQRQTELTNPATLGAVLGVAVQGLMGSHIQGLESLRARLLQAPFLHLKQVFDASSLVDTPTAFFPIPATPASIAGRAAALAIHGVLRVETVAYGTENDGNLFVNLVAIPGEGAFAEKSTKNMRGHTDGVSFPFNDEDDPHDARIAPSPDLVTLVGLRNPQGTPTKVILVADILTRLSSVDVEELRKPQYSIRSQKTFVQGMKRILGREHVLFDAPILKDIGGRTCIRYSHSNVVPSAMEGPGKQASDNLEAVCKEVARPVVLQAGDVLVVNNRLSLHGRGEVGNEVGGQSRWLLRTYGLDTSRLPIHKRHLGDWEPHVLFP